MGLEIYWKILSKRSKVEALGEVGGRRRGGGELEGEEDGDRERERGRKGGRRGVSPPLPGFRGVSLLPTSAIANNDRIFLNL